MENLKKESTRSCSRSARYTKSDYQTLKIHNNKLKLEIKVLLQQMPEKSKYQLLNEGLKDLIT